MRLFAPPWGRLFHTVGNSKNAKTDGTREWRGTVGNGEKARTHGTCDRRHTVGNGKNAKTHGTVGVPDSDFLPWVMAKRQKPTVGIGMDSPISYRW